MASERNAKVNELQSQMKKMDRLFDQNGKPKDTGLIQRLNIVHDYQCQIQKKLAEILEKISEQNEEQRGVDA